jgi:serine/threonine protein phosphatase PrpC
VTLALRFGARSDVGLLRDGNEDSMYAGPRLLAIADGMGGHAAGEVASRVVIEHVAELDQEPANGDITNALRTRIQQANDALRDMVGRDPALDGMGTTLTALLWVEQQLGLAHVGDSRGYLLRDGRLQLITHDHTLVQNLIDEGQISEAEAATHPQRSAITRALDGRREVEADISMQDPRPGDRYLICSDGLSGYVSEETIADALSTADPQEACDQLVELALRAGGPDNVSCIVADLVETDSPPPPQEPIVGGAAADATEPTTAKDSPAARAADVMAAAADDEDEYDEHAGSGDGRGSRWVLAVLIAVVVLLVAGAVGSFLYIRTQYYVATAGDPAHVAVYRGVSGSFLGIDLSRVDTTTDVPVSALPDYDQARLSDQIDASNRDDATRIVGTLQQDACAAAAAQRRAAAKQGKHHQALPPMPAYCSGATGP